jgi:hypothetical protein
MTECARCSGALIESEYADYKGQECLDCGMFVVTGFADGHVAEPRFTSRGMTHQVTIYPTDNGRGTGVWMFNVSSMGGTGLAYITEAEGLKLAATLLAGIPAGTAAPAFDLKELL